MKLNYRKIGEFIRLVNNRNTDLEITNLLGLTTSKKFILSVGNIIGADMTNYKIISKNQFACSLMQVRRDKKMPVALYDKDESAIISQAYPIFEIINTEELHPEYLMMWMTRSEFDREACFYAVGGVRGSLEWDDFCNMELPVPDIEIQKEIVKEYNTIINRIEINNQLIQKCEETAQVIYKQWFVDFEFHDENGKPYKSIGREMEYNEKLDKEIPKGWSVGILNDVVELFISNRGKSKSKMELKQKNSEFIHPVISAMNIKKNRIVKPNTIFYADNNTFAKWMKDPLKIGDVIMTSEAPLGELLYIAKKNDYLLSQRLFALRVNKMKSSGTFLYFWLQTSSAKRDLEARATGTTAQGIRLSELKKLLFLKPPLRLVKHFDENMEVIMNFIEDKKDEIKMLKKMKNLILSKMSKINPIKVKI